jgi:hypothetical protein
VTALGQVTVERTYFTCATCEQGEFGADRVLGIDDFVTPAARRIVTLLGIQHSFAKAEFVLTETVGWTLDDNTIRKLCHQTARQATNNRQKRVTATSFAEAKANGERPVDTELQIDAGKVNTLTGWRDVKVAVFACRERDQPITPAEWEKRDLPAPSVRSVIAAVEEVGRFGERCIAEAKRLEQFDAKEMTVLGDGAEWLWNLADQNFGGAKQVLDFWHGASYLDTGAKVALGTETEEAKAAFARGKRMLLEDGYWGVTEWIGELSGKMAIGGDGAALGGVLNYFSGHQDRLNYAGRLCRGQSIGSGLVEGSIKQLLNKRLKQTGARWKTTHVGPFVEFGALVAGPEWGAFWEDY